MTPDSAKIAFCVLAIAFLATAPARPAEQLANPFGGHPPEYSPGEPEEYSSAHSETWTGTLFGIERTISALVYETPKGHTAELFSIDGHQGDKYCLVEPRLVVLDKTRLKTAPDVGGCWRTSKDASGYVSYVRDLGGERYGSFDCTRDLKRLTGTCTYMSTKGKAHKFSIRGEIQKW